MVVQTSLEAYKELEPEKIGRQQLIVYECIKKSNGVNDKMISQRTGLPINVVTPRRGELEKMNYVKLKDVAKCPFIRKFTKFYVQQNY